MDDGDTCAKMFEQSGLQLGLYESLVYNIYAWFWYVHFIASFNFAGFTDSTLRQTLLNCPLMWDSIIMLVNWAIQLIKQLENAPHFN